MKKIIVLIGLMLIGLSAFGQNYFKYPLIVGSNGGTGGYLRLNGATSGSVTLQVPAVAGTTTFQFPTTSGTSGYVLTTNGSGVLSWAAAGAGSMVYPTGSGIPLVIGGTQWGTTITPYSGYLRYTGTAFEWVNETYSLTGHSQAESTITFSDITTGNASISSHGYLPRLGGGTTNYLRADGTWASPSVGSMVYPSAGIALSTGSAWGTSITNNSSSWNTAFGWGNHAVAGYAPTASPSFTGTVSIPSPFNIGGVSMTSTAAELNLLDGLTSVESYDTENYGATGTGSIVLSTNAILTGAVIHSPSLSTGTVVAATGITAAMLSRNMYFNTASAINITANPQIANGQAGQIITIIGSSDTNTLTLDDADGLRLSASCVLGIGDTITLLYEGTIGDWIEISRSNN